MFVDKKGKLFGLINIVDLCVIIVVLVAIGAIYFKFNLSSHSDIAASDDKVVITYKVASVRDFTLRQFEIGDKLFLEEDDSFIGDIVNVSKEPAQDYIRTVDGKIKKAQMPDKYDVYVDVECSAYIDGDKVYIHGGKQLYQEQENIYYTDTVQTTAKIVDIKKTE